MVTFSSQEIDLLSNDTILLIKNRIFEKGANLLNEIEQHTKRSLAANYLPKEINLLNGKLSKGENYRHLPYLMLDYPAFFSKNDVFAFRTMFYWGHFVSFTIHLSGKYLAFYGDDLISHYKLNNQVYFCINDTPWEYRYNDDNYKLLVQLSNHDFSTHIKENEFIKLSRKIPITQIQGCQSSITSWIDEALDILKKQKL